MNTTTTARGVKVFVVDEMEIVFLNGYYHYVSYKDEIALTGFSRKDSLPKYTEAFLATPEAIARAKKRYQEYFLNYWFPTI